MIPYNPLNSSWFRLWALILAGATSGLVVAPAAGQEPSSDGFQRQYLDADPYRTPGTILGAWPKLARLVRWSEVVERAVAEEGETLSEELLEAFRARIDSLASAGPPSFFDPATADSVQGTIERLVLALDQAEDSVDWVPAPPQTGEGEALNEPTEQRTLVTGSTAVTVPAGVAVGSRDSLPTAELGPDELNFVDRMTIVLTTVDELVHLTRTFGRPAVEATEPPAAPAPTPSPDTGPRPPTP